MDALSGFRTTAGQWGDPVPFKPDLSATPEDDAASGPRTVLRRRYTVTVGPDGAETLDDIEEWEEERS